MNRLDYLSSGKRFLRKVARQRLNLIVHNVGYLPPSLNKEPNTILHHIQTIHSAAQMQRYIERRQDTLKLMIPANCIKWFDELRELLAGVEERVEN
ncbi:hypothetical protein [Mangrovibacterium sp.]|uniref:hypothetical protein n=1 Tax=Mangrovibacterium sp. TaxID=1961364 RepID=UPI003564E10A